jgi:PEP-CTERM motif
MSMRSGWIGGLLLLAFGGWGVFMTSPARAQLVILSVDFEAPFPNSAPAGPGSYIAVNNNPNTGNFQVQGGTGGTGTIAMTTGIDTSGFPAATDAPNVHQALFANWDFSLGQQYTYNQYTFYGQPGLVTAVPLNQVQVSLDVSASGNESSVPMYVDYQQGSNQSEFSFSLADSAYHHISFTLNQGVQTGTIDLTQPFNFRLGHGVGGFGFDANDIVHLDNVLVQTIIPVVVPGDYNSDGAVDAADYILWRDNLGSTTYTLANRSPSNTGAISQSDYDFWKSRFGATSGAGAGLTSGGAVPEPSSLILGVLGLLTLFAARRNRG